MMSRSLTMASMSEQLPLLAADLTFVRVNGGRAYSGLVDWDETRQPQAGDHVMVADGGSGPFEAVIEEARADGTIVLTVRAFATRRQAAT